jgi:hypothetical protein
MVTFISALSHVKIIFVWYKAVDGLQGFCTFMNALDVSFTELLYFP